MAKRKRHSVTATTYQFDSGIDRGIEALAHATGWTKRTVVEAGVAYLLGQTRGVQTGMVEALMKGRETKE